MEYEDTPRNRHRFSRRAARAGGFQKTRDALADADKRKGWIA